MGGVVCEELFCVLAGEGDTSLPHYICSSFPAIITNASFQHATLQKQITISLLSYKFRD